jgi:hypothetical protein
MLTNRLSFIETAMALARFSQRGCSRRLTCPLGDRV